MADLDLISRQEARDLAAAARTAFSTYREFAQEQVDAVVDAMAAAGARESERLARMAVEETGFGKVPDKLTKNLFVCEQLYRYVRGLKTVGIIRESPSVIEIAEPVGVVAGIIPSTNPTSTVFYKCLISLKARNAIVISPHPAARRCTIEAARVMAEAAVGAGAPAGIIGCMQTPSQDGSQELMSHRDIAVILATGGPSIVKAAYSSGKPAFGVGPGNVPVYVDRSADVPKAVRDAVAGKVFDNGTVCASEQSLIVDAPVKDQVNAELVRNGAYILDPDEASRLSAILLTPGGGINPDLVGRTPHVIARKAGFEVPESIDLLVAPLERAGPDVPLSREKLSPILALFVVDGWIQGCEMCKKILGIGGMGHTLGIHATDRDVILQFGLQKPAHRIIVNSSTTYGAIGFTTDLPPSLTLGCGAVGNNITSDNITPLHLINVKRVAFETKPLAARPTSQTSSLPPLIPGAGRPLGDKIREFLASRGDLTKGILPGPTSTNTPTPASPPTAQPPAPVTPAPQPVDFVCEADVRRAADRGEKIVIGARTIITPAARDLGNQKGVFA